MGEAGGGQEKGKNLFTKMSTFFNWEITRLTQFYVCLFIEPRISWWSETQTVLTCTSHWPVCNSAKLNSYQFPLCHVASQLDVMTLSSNVFPLVRYRITVEISLIWIVVFAKAGRRLEPVYMKGGGPQVGEVTSLGRVTRLSTQSFIWLPAPIM